MDDFEEFISLIDDAATDLPEAFFDEIGFSGGYSLKNIAKTAMNEIGDPKLVLEIAIVGAMSGNNPRDADKIKLCNGASFSAFLDTMQRNGVFHRGAPGATTQGAGKKLTPVRLSAAFAEPVAQALKRAHDVKPLSKRFKNNKLPPCYEFAGFGTLDLPENFRNEHLIFSHEFSKAIGKGDVLDMEIYKKTVADTVPVRKLMINARDLVDVDRPRASVEELCKMIDEGKLDFR